MAMGLKQITTISNEIDSEVNQIRNAHMADKQQLQARNRELAKTINNLRKQLTDTQQELRKTKQDLEDARADLNTIVYVTFSFGLRSDLEIGTYEMQLSKQWHLCFMPLTGRIIHIIPAHIRMLHTLPEYIVDHFRNGAFVSSITGANFSQIASDEGQEMLINKDCKISFSHHLPLCATLQCQAQLVKQLEEQL